MNLREYLLEKLDTVVFTEGEEYLDMLDEGLFTGMPKHIAKAITNKYQLGAAPAGENSPHEVHQPKTMAKALAHVKDAMKDGHHAIVKVNGHLIGAYHKKEDYSGSRTKYGAYDQQAAHAAKRSEWQRPRYKGDTGHIHSWNDTSLSKGEAEGHLQHQLHKAGIDKDNYKHNNVEVHVIHADPVRKQKRLDNIKRNTARLEPSPKSLSGITDRAAAKLAVKHLGPVGNTPHAAAKDIHAKIGAALESGDHKAAVHHIGELQAHIRNKGLGTDSHDHVYHASDLKDLKRFSSSYNKQRIRDRIAKARGE